MVKSFTRKKHKKHKKHKKSDISYSNCKSYKSYKKYKNYKKNKKGGSMYSDFVQDHINNFPLQNMVNTWRGMLNNISNTYSDYIGIEHDPVNNPYPEYQPRLIKHNY